MVEANTKILILEKDPVDTALLQKELDQSFGKYTARIVQTKKEFEDALRDFEPDIILSDYSIPDFNWDDAFLLKQKLAPGTPFILLSDNAAKEDIIDQIRRGVTDCIFKDNPGSLAPKVKRALEYAKKNVQNEREVEVLKKNATTLSTMFDNTDVGFLFLTSEYKVIGFNHISSHWACAVFGFDLKENMNFKNALLPDRVPAFTGFIQNILKGNTITYEANYARADGTLMWFIVNGKPVIDNQNTIGVCISVTDITSRKAAEDRMEFDTNNLCSLINNTSDLMWSVDRNFNLITCNDAFAQKVKTWSGKTIEKGAPVLTSEMGPKRYNYYKALLERAMTGETFRDVEYNLSPDESWLEVSFYPIRLGEEVIGTACFSHDITAQKIADIEIKELNERSQAANEQLSIILNTLPANIALLDDAGAIVVVNAAWAKFADDNDLNSEHHGIGANYIDVCERATGAEHKTAIEIAIALRHILGGEMKEFAMEYPCHSPTEKRWYRVEIRPLPESKNTGAVVMHINITEQVLAEIAIVDTNNKLEIRVNERTVELMDANTALEAFSYSVSHDLRSPVRALIGFAEMINKDYASTLDPEVKDLFGYIESSSRRLDNIIKDLLVLAKSGKDKLNVEEVNLNLLVAGVWHSLLIEHPHHCLLTLKPLPTVQADRSMLQQVIVNMLSNAIKYSSKKEKPEIEIGYIESEGEDTIYVKDNGAGFDMKFYDRLFGAFQRLHGMSEFEGTGIGLMLIKRIVDRHGGKVWAEGEVNRGATFYFSLPKQIKV